VIASAVVFAFLIVTISSLSSVLRMFAMGGIMVGGKGALAYNLFLVNNGVFGAFE
jgi:hypothetical protein